VGNPAEETCCHPNNLDSTIQCSPVKSPAGLMPNAAYLVGPSKTSATPATGAPPAPLLPRPVCCVEMGATTTTVTAGASPRRVVPSRCIPSLPRGASRKQMPL